MKKFYNLLFFLVPSFLVAQFAVVSTQPANNAIDVPLTTTISITFNEALDTNAINDHAEDSWFLNADSMVSYGYSADLKTTFGTYVLKPNTPYFVAFTWVKALSGAVISTPYVYYFTTGSTFPTTSVSGTVLSGSTGVSPQDAIVALMNIPIGQDDKEGPPPLVGWANVNTDGTFSIPYISDGTYWPLAAKDVNHDGYIRPDDGVDVIALGDSIVVAGSSVINVLLTFMSFSPYTFHEANEIADSLDEDLPADKVLRYVTAWDADSLGRSGSWEFNYTANNNADGYQLRVGPFEMRIDTIYDQWHLDWVRSHKPLTNPANAASSTVVMTNVENAGGLAFRQTPHPDTLELSIEMSLGDMARHDFWHLVPDTNQMYWGVMYILGVNYEPWRIDGQKYLCSFTPGNVIGSSPLTVERPKTVPGEFMLYQNYPNPFNPATTLSFTVPTDGRAKLTIVDLLGQEIATVYDDNARTGTVHQCQFNGERCASGVYFARLMFNGRLLMKKLVLMK